MKRVFFLFCSAIYFLFCARPLILFMPIKRKFIDCICKCKKAAALFCASVFSWKAQGSWRKFETHGKDSGRCSNECGWELLKWICRKMSLFVVSFFFGSLVSSLCTSCLRPKVNVEDKYGNHKRTFPRMLCCCVDMHTNGRLCFRQRQDEEGWIRTALRVMILLWIHFSRYQYICRQTQSLLNSCCEKETAVFRLALQRFSGKRMAAKHEVNLPNYVSLNWEGQPWVRWRPCPAGWDTDRAR